MPVVEARYAEALLTAVPSPAAADGAGEALSELSNLWQTDAALSFFMQNPVVPNAVKKDTVLKLFPDTDKPDRLFYNFINLLIDKKRLSYLPEIEKEYSKIKNKTRNCLSMAVISARPLDNGQLDAIREKYRVKYGAAYATAVNVIEPGLIGGVRVKIGDAFVDDTLSGHLKNLQICFDE